jgi:FtsP/CotA-like multicopper oxidase with cupredoxin domain
MSRAQRLSFLGIAAVIAVVAVILLAGGGDETGDSGKSASSDATPTASATATADDTAEATATATPKPKPKPPLLQAGKEKALTFKEGETVRFRVVSDEAEEVHVHGYDIKQELEPGKTETLSFKATITGIFEIELEGSGTLLAQLKVVP